MGTMKITAVAFTAAISSASARTLSGAGTTNTDAHIGGDGGSLPPAYLQVPEFKCLASETSEDGSYEQWCMPAQMPAGCATDSWTMLSSADMEMAACSNEEDEPTMVGTEKAI